MGGYRTAILVVLFMCCFIGFSNANCGPRDSGAPLIEVLMWSGGSWAGYANDDYFSAPNYLGHDVDKKTWYGGKGCPVDCRYTSDKSRVGNVDAVIFEAQPITSYYDAYKWSPPNFPQKYSGQKWVNHGYETQYYFHLYGDPGYMHYIDTNFTYYLHSQVPLTFTCLWGGGNFSDFLKPPPPKAKDKCVVFMTTNCQSGGAGARTAYAKELMDHMSVDSFGRCLHNKDFPPEMQFPIYSDHGASMRNKIWIFTHYKFVLVFENNNVTDYVTEKLTNVLQAGSVPVYMGSENVHPYWTPGENSIVKFSDYKGPADLARFLQKACDDDDEYSKFFEWKKKGVSAHFQQRFNDCAFYGSECRLCQYLHEQREKLPENQRKKVDRRRSERHTYRVAQFESSLKQFISAEFNENMKPTSGLSVSAWIKTDALDSYIVDGGPYHLKLVKEKAANRAFPQLCVKSECFTSGLPVNNLSWQHIAVSYNYSSDGTGQVKFFINGFEDPGVDIPAIPLTEEDYATKPELLIGTDRKNQIYFKGYLDDVAVWKRGLNLVEGRTAVYDVYAGHEAELAAYYSFNFGENPTTDVLTGKVAISHNKVVFAEGLTKPLITVHPRL